MTLRKEKLCKYDSMYKEKTLDGELGKRDCQNTLQIKRHNLLKKKRGDQFQGWKLRLFKRFEIWVGGNQGIPLGKKEF